MGNRIRGRQQLEAVEVWQEVVTDQAMLSRRPLWLDDLEGFVRRAEEEGAGADGRIKQDNRRVGQALVTSQLTAKQGVYGLDDVGDEFAGRVVDTALLPLTSVVLLQKSFIEVER